MTHLGRNNVNDNNLNNTKLYKELKENNINNYTKMTIKINEKTIEKTFINNSMNLTILNNTKINESLTNLIENKVSNLTHKFPNDLLNNKSKINIEKKKIDQKTIEHKTEISISIENKTDNQTKKPSINYTERLNNNINKFNNKNKTNLENIKEDIKINKEKKDEERNINENFSYPQSFIGKYTYFIQKDINKFIPPPLDNLIIMCYGYIFMTLIITFINSFQENNNNNSQINEGKILHAIRQIKIKGNNNNISKNDFNITQNFDINEKNLKEFINLKMQLNELLDITQKRNNKLSNENITRENICDLQTRIMLKINN